MKPVVRYAVAQSVTEIALGSLVHAFHLPLGGHLLSLNQGLLLTLATHHARNRRDAVSIVSRIANSTAVLKALSPIGNRITPMLAISVQGSLFAAGVGVFGANQLGVALGSALLSLWGFAQPLLIAYLILGREFFLGVQKLWLDLAQLFSIPESVGAGILIGFVLCKALIAVIVSGIAWRSGSVFEARYLHWLERWSLRALPTRNTVTSEGPVRGAVSEVMSPWFLIAWAISVGFFMLTAQADWTRVIIYALRVLATALLVFWALRAVPSAWIEKGLARLPGLRNIVDQVLGRLR